MAVSGPVDRPASIVGCGLKPDPAVAEAILLDDGQVKRVLAETERLEKCNRVVLRTLVHVVE